MAGAFPNFDSMSEIKNLKSAMLHPKIDLMPGANMTTPELIAFNGYPVEIHHVITDDGYILELHRIPHGLAGPNVGEPKVAFLHHCLLCSSADYVMNTPDKALAYLMAEAGYDVWMTNVRGNTYSRNHTTLSPDDSKFWQFTQDAHSCTKTPTQEYLLIDQAVPTTRSTRSAIFFKMAANSKNRPLHQLKTPCLVERFLA
ncbi:unnamed protein product, partial [Meganyctiphanes norvegica]